MNALSRLLLGPGRLPEPLRSELLAEDVLVLAEGLSGSVTYRDFRAPGQRTSLEKRAASGAIAVTSRRMVVWAGRMKHIDMPLRHPLRGTITVQADRPDRVLFSYDAGATNTAMSGTVEVRLHTDLADRIVALLTP